MVSLIKNFIAKNRYINIFFILLLLFDCSKNKLNKQTKEFIKTDKYKESISKVKKIRDELIDYLKNNPDIPPEVKSETYSKIGGFYTMEFNYDKAIRYHKKAIELNSNNSISYQELGYLYYMKNKYKKSIHYLEKQININEFDGSIYYYLALDYYSIDNYNKSLEFLEKFLTFDLDSREVYNKEAAKRFRTERIPAIRKLKNELVSYLNSNK